MTEEKILEIVEHKSCRSCGKKGLEPILSLGDQYVVNFLDSPDQKVFKAPLELELCDKTKGGCGLVQLKHTVPADFLYRKFWYKSGVNQSMKDALHDISQNAQKWADPRPGEIVVDIGANDGTLLRSDGDKNLVLV